MTAKRFHMKCVDPALTAKAPLVVLTALVAGAALPHALVAQGLVCGANFRTGVVTTAATSGSGTGFTINITTVDTSGAITGTAVASKGVGYAVGDSGTIDNPNHDN